MSKQLKILVVEDEPFVRADLCAMLGEHPATEPPVEAESVQEAADALHHTQFDAVFLDIQIRGGNGFDVLKSVHEDTNIVFFTSHEEYAVKAFELDAVDYLLKPVSQERLFQAIERIQHKIELEDIGRGSAPPPDLEGAVMVQSQERWFSVPIADIIAVISVGGNYTAVHATGAIPPSLTVRKTFKEWQDVLPSPPFERIHRQSIVNLDFLSDLEKTESGIWEIRLNGLDTPLQISRRSLPKIKALLSSTARQSRPVVGLV